MSIKKSTKYSGKYSSPDARKTEIDLPGVKEGPGQFQILAQAVVNTIQQPVLVLDHALQVVTANQLYCDIFQTSSPQIVSKNIDQVNSNFNNSLLFKKLSGLKHAGDHFDNIEICSKSDSKHDLLFASGRKILDTPENQLIMLTFSFGNEVDQSCREEEEYLHTVANSSPILLWITDSQKKATFFNKGWLEFTGRTMEDEIGTGWTNTVHPDDREMVKKTFSRTFDLHADFYCEYRLKKHDGTYRWVSVKGVPRYSNDGTFLGYVGGCMDIDVQKRFASALEEQVEQRTKALQDSQAFLKSVLDTTQNLIYIYDLEKARIIFINGRSLEATGYTPEEFAAADVDLFTPLIHQDDLNSVLSQRQLMLENRAGEMEAVEFRLKNKNGWSCQLSRNMIFKRDDSGRPVQYLGVCTDISEIKNAHALLESKNNELERSNIELASFSSIASHDLKEPLRKIMIFSKLILANDRKNISDDSQGFLDRVIVSANRMQQLIDDLISYSRTSTQTKLKYTSSDINLLIDDALDDLAEIIQEENAIVSADELPVLAVYPSQFRQLFLNLIGNALKYRRHDVSPVIKINSQKATRKEVLQFEGRPDQDYCKIIVADNGIGFPEEYKEKIFEPFQRLHDKDEYSGTGIGLAICRKIMTNHNGHIKAESSPGGGATFSIYVPWIN